MDIAAEETAQVQHAAECAGYSDQAGIGGGPSDVAVFIVRPGAEADLTRLPYQTIAVARRHVGYVIRNVRLVAQHRIIPGDDPGIGLMSERIELQRPAERGGPAIAPAAGGIAAGREIRRQVQDLWLPGTPGRRINRSTSRAVGLRHCASLPAGQDVDASYGIFPPYQL